MAKIMNQQTNNSLESLLPVGWDLARLTELWSNTYAQYSTAFTKFRVLDACDRNRMWEAIGAKFPKHQILPYTNHVSYVKSNILASVYTVGKVADILPTSEKDKDIIEAINLFMEHHWSVSKVGYFEMLAGERAALGNIGITQVGWDAELNTGNGDTYVPGGPTYKNINPMKFMRDTAAEDLQTSSFCVIWEDFHKSVILKNPLYKEQFDKFLASKTSAQTTDPQSQHLDHYRDANVTLRNDYYRIYTWWIKTDDGDICEVHTVNNKMVLKIKPVIKPNMFPFAILYCNLPSGDLIGTSEPSKIFANSLAYNLMNSMLLTSEYINQRPPRLVSSQSGINVQAFTKNGNDPDKVFVVNGDASKAVHYHQFPTPSAQSISVNSILSNDIQNTTGVDGRYTGRDTGSILTTGGIQDMLNQVTLIDAPRVALYEDYTLQLTKLILSNFIAYGGTRKYIVKDPANFNEFKTVTVNFPKIKSTDIFNYEINISSQLPKNKQRIAEVATQIMEKQLQYRSGGYEVNWITPEEWLRYQDIPMKEQMLERMGLERQANAVEDVTETVVGFNELVKAGMQPQDAISVMAQNMVNKKDPNKKTFGELAPQGEQQLPPDLGA